MSMFNPPHPGEILKEDYLIPKGLTVTQVSEGLGVARKNLSAIINGHAGISPEMAIRLSKAFNTSPEFWINMQAEYDLWKAKQKAPDIRVQSFVKEDLKDIANGIQRHRELESVERIPVKAVGRSSTRLEGRDQVFWLTNKEDTGGYRKQFDITGDITGQTEVGNKVVVKQDGFPVYKNTRLGEILIKNCEGSHEYESPGGKRIIEILNQAKYNPVWDTTHDKAEAEDLIIQLGGEDGPFRYRNLSELIKEIVQVDEEIEEISQKEEQVGHDVGKIEELKARLELKKNQLRRAQSFVRRTAELRLQHVLDPLQEEIKRSNIFEGTLAITGGPGTGKTASLVQRIKFLTANSIEEYLPGLSTKKLERITSPNGWMFFSPSQLLRLYLQRNMLEEGLSASHERVKVWEDQRLRLCRDYRLFHPDSGGPFLDYGKKETFFIGDNTSVSDVIHRFQAYFLTAQHEKIDKVLSLNINQFSWKRTGLSIQQFLKEKGIGSSWEDYIKLYFNLQANYYQEVNEISENYSKLVNDIAARIQLRLEDDLNRKTRLNKMLSRPAEPSQEEDDITELDSLEDEEEFQDYELRLNNKLKILAKKLALSRYDSSISLNKDEKEILTVIPELTDQPEYEQLGQLTYFGKYLEKICKGLATNIFNEIPRTYKQFRTTEDFSSVLTQKGKQYLSEILNDRNTRLHKEEQALLLFIINETIRQVHDINPKQYSTLSHPYVKAFRSHCKSVIGVDEATDFGLLDLICMHSLRDPEIHSVTFSGDPMQQLVPNGIASWESLKTFIEDLDVRRLHVSYRQSPTLLKVALTIHEQATGQQPKYLPYLQRDENEPVPNLLVSQDEVTKIAWIADTIKETYNAYGNMIPSIAVFLAMESSIDTFSSALGKLPELADHGIKVKPCHSGEVLGDKDTVRVFSIDHIKGLEFEAVFFHDIHELEGKAEIASIIDKYLYVGLSRAVFYLNVTSNRPFQPPFEYLNNLFTLHSK